jgi:hypothetical protein
MEIDPESSVASAFADSPELLPHANKSNAEVRIV